MIQDVPGVLAADIDELQPKRPADRDRPNVDRLRRRIAGAGSSRTSAIFPARPDPLHPGSVLPAELATVEDPPPRTSTLAGDRRLDG